MRHFSNPYITGHFIMISVEETAVKVTPLSFFFYRKQIVFFF